MRCIIPPRIKMIRVTKKKPDTTPVQLRKRRNNESLRLLTLQRDNYTCRSCLEPYPEYKLESDHIIPLNNGGKDDLTNTQCLCIPCHRVKTNIEASLTRSATLRENNHSSRN